MSILLCCHDLVSEEASLLTVLYGAGHSPEDCTLSDRWLATHAGSRWWAALVGLLVGVGLGTGATGPALLSWTAAAKAGTLRGMVPLTQIVWASM